MAFYKRHILLFLISVLTLGASAQDDVVSVQNTNLFKDIELGVEAGTLGAGIFVSVPVTDNLRIRAGYDHEPNCNIPVSFSLTAYAGTDENISADTKFDKLSALMYDFTGFKIDKDIKMQAHSTMGNVKLLVDWYPTANKRFYTTAGVFYGPSKVGHIENDIHEAPSLVGVMMYNKMYEFFMNYEYFDKPLYGDIYFDPMTGDVMRSKFERYGRVGAHIGDFNSSAPAYLEGEPYMLEPDADGVVSADLYYNRLKPYLGVGFNIFSGDRFKLNIEGGGLYWGRAKIYTHERYAHGKGGTGSPADEWEAGYYGDRVNVASEVDNIKGKVGKYVNWAKTFKVFPVVMLSLSYTFN